MFWVLVDVGFGLIPWVFVFCSVTFFHSFLCMMIGEGCLYGLFLGCTTAMLFYCSIVLLLYCSAFLQLSEVGCEGEKCLFFPLVVGFSLSL